MPNEDRISAAMLKWEERWRQGEELSAEELCDGKPELAATLRLEIQALKGMSWLAEVDEADEPTSPSPPPHARRNGNGRLPATSLSVDEFAESVCTSGLLSADELRQFRQAAAQADVQQDARLLAEALVSHGKLTKYQASVVLEKRSDPLLIDRYIILDALDSGGMGLVFKALHKAMDRVVALKVLPPNSVDSPDKVQRFQREAKAAAKLSHPNIVAVFDADEAAGTHFLAMEYVQGQNLFDYVLEHGPLSVGQAVNCVVQAARGLEHAHQHRVIHRDVKPSNLMLTAGQAVGEPVGVSPRTNTDVRGLTPPGSPARWAIKVLDMGLAHIDSPMNLELTAQELTQGGIVLGTIAYMSPEQALDTRQADARSDVYSLGATLYFLLTGRPPYNETTAMKTLLAHRESPIPALGDTRNDVPDELEAVYQRMLAKRPDDRFRSMADVIEALEAIAIDGADSSSLLPAISVPAADTGPVATANDETVAYARSSSSQPSPLAAKSGGRWIVSALLLVTLLGAAGVYFAPVVFKFDTPAGTLVVEVDQPGASIEVDGEQLTIKRPADKQPLTISVDPGQHRLRVRKDGFELFAKEFSIDAGRRESIQVRLEPLSTELPMVAAPVTKQPTLTDLWTPGPADEVLPGLIAAPAKKPGIRRWQMETVHTRGSDRVSLDWNPNGTLIACGMQYGTIQLCDAETLELVCCLVGHTAGVNDVAWHPNGTLLASAGGDGTVRLWSADGRQGPVLKGHEGVVTSVAWSPDGSRLASSGGDKTVRLWSADGSSGPVLTGHTKPVNCVAWSPNGKQLASGSEDSTIQLWNSDGTPAQTIPIGESKSITRVAWSPDGKQLASAAHFQSRVQIWNLDGSRGPTFDEHKSYVVDMSWNPNVQLLASGGADGTLRMWRSDGTLQKTITHPGYVRAVAWSPDGQRVVSVGGSGALCTWSFRGEKLRERPGDIDWGWPSLAWSPDGQTLASTHHVPSVIRLWNADGTLRSTLPGHTGKVSAVAWSSDGGQLASSSYDKTIRLWKSDGTPGPVLKGHTDMMMTVAWSADGTQLASAGTDKTIRLWKADGTAGRVLEGHTGVIEGVAWSSDGNWLASIGGSNDASLRIWPMNGDAAANGKILAKVGLAGRAVAWQPGGDWLAAGGAGTVLLMKVDGQRGPRFNVDNLYAKSIAWSPNGQQFAVGDGAQWRSSKVQLWNLDGSPGPVFDHQGSSVCSIAWTLDGKRLAAADSDRTIHVWDAATRRTEWKSVMVGDGKTVTFASDGQLLDGDHDTLDQHFVDIVEHNDGRLQTLKPSEFEKLATGSQGQQAFFDAVARLAPPAQVQAVADKLKQVNPGFKGTIEHATVDGAGAKLIVRGGWFTDMWPLTALVDLTLDAEITPQTDLSPLANLPLAHLSGVSVSPVNERAPELVAALPRLKTINGVPPQAWLARRQEIEELRKILPTLAPKTQLAQVVAKLKEYNPGFDGELTDSGIEDGKVVGIVVREKPQLVDFSPLRALPNLQELSCTSTGVADLSPLIGMHLRVLNIEKNHRISDLSPLQGMPLTFLSCGFGPSGGQPLVHIPICDLSPLQGMPLKSLYLVRTGVTDLSPLKGMSLTDLNCTYTNVSDLSPLVGMPLTDFDCKRTRVSDLSPLKGMQLKFFACDHTGVADLSPLKGMPLQALSLTNCSQITDLSPINGMPLVYLNCRNTGLSDFPVLKGMPLERIVVSLFLFDDVQHAVLKSLSLKTIDGFDGSQPAAEFWKQVATRRQAAEEFRDATAALPPEEQVKAVAARLKELNPKQDVTLKPILRDGTVVEATLGGKPLNITPLMAFTKLEKLTFANPNPVGWPDLDLSPATTLPLKELTCPDLIVLSNAAVLRDCKTLETINGQPAAECLDKLRAALNST